jgi:hypothetical protein
MVEQELKDILKNQVARLEDLVVHLEDCSALGSEEYHYCQARLQEVLGRLKQLERIAGSEGERH